MEKHLSLSSGLVLFFLGGKKEPQPTAPLEVLYKEKKKKQEGSRSKIETEEKEHWVRVHQVCIEYFLSWHIVDPNSAFRKKGI